MTPSGDMMAAAAALLGGVGLLLVLSLFPVVLSGRRLGAPWWLLAPWMVFVTGSVATWFFLDDVATRAMTSPATNWYQVTTEIRSALTATRVSWLVGGMLCLGSSVLCFVAARIVGGRAENPEERPPLQTTGLMLVFVSMLSFSLSGIQGSRVYYLNRISWQPLDSAMELGTIIGPLGGSIPWFGVLCMFSFGLLGLFSMARHLDRRNTLAFGIAAGMLVPLLGAHVASDLKLREAVAAAQKPQLAYKRKLEAEGFELPEVRIGSVTVVDPEVALWPDGRIVVDAQTTVTVDQLGNEIGNTVPGQMGAQRNWYTIYLRIHRELPYSTVAPVLQELQAAQFRSITVLVVNPYEQTTGQYMSIDSSTTAPHTLGVYADRWELDGTSATDLQKLRYMAEQRVLDTTALDIVVDKEASWEQVMQGAGELQQVAWFSELRLNPNPR